MTKANNLSESVIFPLQSTFGLFILRLKQMYRQALRNGPNP